MNHQYHITTLSNGLRAIAVKSQGQVSYIGVAINAGSRDESSDRYGLAHFVEHTIFKGTEKRRSWHISNRMESIGGELNAYTSKEETVIYTNAPSGYAERAIELLSDIICSSVFPPQEIEREKEVVIEEIHSYLDSPADSVYDEFEELIYSGSGLAHNILGTPDSVRSLDSRSCREFIERLYTPGEMVVYCSDPGDPEKNIKLIEKYFGRLHFYDIKRDRRHPEILSPFCEEKEKDRFQANTILGCRLFGRNDPRRFPLFLLNNYLGGPCMNSRLNQELREKRGLVYTVDSSVALLSDAGTIMIYFGSDRKTVDKCCRLVNAEIDRLAQSPLSPSSFAKILTQYTGQLKVNTDHRESSAMSLGKSILYYNEVRDIATMTNDLLEVTPEQMMEVARLISGNLSRLTLC